MSPSRPVSVAVASLSENGILNVVPTSTAVARHAVDDNVTLFTCANATGTLTSFAELVGRGLYVASQNRTVQSLDELRLNNTLLASLYATNIALNVSSGILQSKTIATFEPFAPTTRLSGSSLLLWNQSASVSLHGVGCWNDSVLVILPVANASALRSSTFRPSSAWTSFDHATATTNDYAALEIAVTQAVRDWYIVKHVQVVTNLALTAVPKNSGECGQPWVRFLNSSLTVATWTSNKTRVYFDSGVLVAEQTCDLNRRNLYVLNTSTVLSNRYYTNVTPWSVPPYAPSMSICDLVTAQEPGACLCKRSLFLSNNICRHNCAM